MQYWLYYSTGFNPVNIPDSPATLQGAAKASVSGDTIDLVQNYWLDSITVSTTWDAVKSVDYARVDNMYYFVSGITMTSADVAVISLTPDFVTSAGGPGALTILDGITERHHVSKSADTFGAYTEDDPLLTPSKPLQLAIANGPYMGTNPNYWAFVESTIDLYKMGEQSNGDYTNKTAVTYTDDNTSETVTVPATIATESDIECTFWMGGSSTTTGDDAMHTKTHATAIFDGDNTQVQQGMQRARDIGSEDAIIAQWQIPKDMCNALYKYRADDTGAETADTGAFGYINDADSTITHELTDANFDFSYASPNNKRVLYGSNNRYGLLTAAGNSAEYDPEDIQGGSTTRPAIVYRADCRNDGKPYYNYGYYRGVSTLDNNMAFFRNAVGGLEWRNLPLKFVQASHNVQDAYNYNSTMREQSTAQDLTQGQALSSGVQGTIGSVLSGIVGGLVTGNPVGAIGGAIGSAVSGAMGVTNTAMSMAANKNAYERAREREMYNFGVSQNVVVPTLKFPFQSPAIRDYAGNGVVAYRYYLADSDITKLDRLLTAYGYKDTALLTTDMFTSRTYFNYVQTSGVSIGGDLPQWWKSGIADQLNAGVRIWHTKPSSTYYSGAN